MRAADATFAPYTSNVRSAAKSYVRYFLEGKLGNENDQTDEATPEENAISVFKYENELQEALRKQLAAIESGLVIDDGGYENVFPTGRSDILARDSLGHAVVIELKAGRCPKGAIEQVLGYVQDWIDGGEAQVRAIIIAGEFPDRVKAAAKRIPDLKLMTYRLQVQVEPA